MQTFPQPIARWNRRRRRRLLATLWIVSAAQLGLVVVHPAGLQQPLGPVLLGISVLTLLVLAAAAHQLTQRPTSTPGLTFMATAQGGPCDGASWPVHPDQHPVPRRVWLPVHGENHLYLLASHRTTEAANPSVTLTYTHHPADIPGTPS